MVACLDALNDLTTKTQNGRGELHFAFIGDSRTRQQFFNFVRVSKDKLAIRMFHGWLKKRFLSHRFQLIPQYDKKSSPSIVPDNYHNDVEVTSNLLNIRVSFKWRPLVSDDVTKELRWLVNSNKTDRPYVIFLGIRNDHAFVPTFLLAFSVCFKRERYGSMAHASKRRRWLPTVPKETFEFGACSRPIGARQPNRLAEPIPKRRFQSRNRRLQNRWNCFGEDSSLQRGCSAFTLVSYIIKKNTWIRIIKKYTR